MRAFAARPQGLKAFALVEEKGLGKVGGVLRLSPINCQSPLSCRGYQGRLSLVSCPAPVFPVSTRPVEKLASGQELCDVWGGTAVPAAP